MACPVCFERLTRSSPGRQVGVLVMLGFIVPLLVAIAFHRAQLGAKGPALSTHRERIRSTLRTLLRFDELVRNAISSF